MNSRRLVTAFRPRAITLSHRRMGVVHHSKKRRSTSATGQKRTLFSVCRLRQLRDIRRDPPGRILAEQLCRRSPSRLFSEMPYLVHLLSSSESMDINSLASLDFGSTSSNPSINLKYSGPSLLSSDSACLLSASSVLVSFFCSAALT